MEIVNASIEAYIEELLPPRDAILTEMEERAARTDFPIVGPLVGSVLAQYAMLLQARRVFEFGSGFGYSAYWFVKAMGGRGQVVLTEEDAETARAAAGYFHRAQLDRCVTIEVGDAIEVIQRQPELFDIIFIDCDKARYPLAYERALPRLRKGGLLIADNVLWHGAVVEQQDDPRTLGVRKYNMMSAASEEVFTTILPIRDGLSVGVKR